MAALVGLQSRCQIDMRCVHRFGRKPGLSGPAPGPSLVIGCRDWLAQGVYTLAKICGRAQRPSCSRPNSILSEFYFCAIHTHCPLPYHWRKLKLAKHFAPLYFFFQPVGFL